MKKVSLILTTFNSINNLSQTVDSILCQDYQNIEIVIKDGGSTDGTIDAIQKYAAAHPHMVIWHSSPDTGIYDAMNQGYSLSTGDVVAFFNDKFTDHSAVSKLVDTMNRTDSDGVHADLIYASDNKIVRYWHMGNGNLRQGWMPGHPTLYLNREIYETYGLYNTTYTISADYEFMVRILKDDKVKLAYVPEVLVAMFYGGTSNSTLNSYLISLKEGHRALVENKIRYPWLIDIKRTLRVLLQFTRFSGKRN